MAGEPEQEKSTSEETASSETGTGNSASTTPDSKKPAADESDNGDATDPAKTSASGGEQPAAPKRNAEAGERVDSINDADDAKQLALPGMPEPPPEEDPDHDDHDGYHDEYQDDHYYDEYHHDEHHDEYHHDEYHHDEHHNDDHYAGYHNDPHHNAYRSGGGSYVPLDQRNVPEADNDWEPELDEDGNPYGGPVKPFLDHLEDLRWTILKCVFALLIAMLACMMGAKYLVGVLTYPLDQARRLGHNTRTPTEIPVKMGNRTVGQLKIEGLEQFGFNTTNDPVFKSHNGRLQLVPVQHITATSTNLLLALEPHIPPERKGILTGLDEVMVELKNYGPFQSIWLCLQLALYGGLVFSAPFIIFFVAEFVLPALKVSEKKFLYKAAGIGSVLFMLGVVFCYFLIVQVAVRASVEFSNWMGFGADEWNASEYIGFVVKFLLVMGLAFEMPVVLLTIVKIGLLDYKKLSEMRSYFVVGMLVAAAVITPSGDPFTMTLVAIPLWILYEICVLIARVWYKKEEALEAAENAPNNPPPPKPETEPEIAKESPAEDKSEDNSTDKKSDS